MTAPGKQGSKWGSYFQQAVAGVESRLDNLLADGIEGEQAPATSKPATLAPGTPATKSQAPSRTASTNRTNDRLQERLARAVAAKNAQKAERADSLALSSGVPSRTGSPANTGGSPRASIEVTAAVGEKDATKEASEEITSQDGTSAAGSRTASLDVPRPAATQEDPSGGITKSDIEVLPRPSGESARSSLPRESLDILRSTSTPPRSSIDLPSNERPDVGSAAKTPAEHEAHLKQIQSDYEASELQRQEEIHGYIERIDALQAKLQYLAKESAEAARKASGAAPSGSMDKKLADKEQQVALLMEEGQQLSKKELAHLTTIKKLRAKIQEDSKEVAEAKRKQEKAEKDAVLIAEKLRRADGTERRLTESQKAASQLQKELQALKSENDSKDATISDLKLQLEDAVAQQNSAEIKAAREDLEFERKRCAELQDDIANLKIEKNLVADRGQAQIKDLREKMDKEVERARLAEMEMKNEQHMLESKLELMRARAEEVSSGATGDARAKLLRQIETLQTQYAVASENWQGMEASLIARATSLEKERDEATKREADIRRKAREVSLKAKRNEDELEEARSKVPSFQQELAEHKAKLDSLQQRAEKAEVALVEAKASFEQEKQAWKAEMQNRVEEEKQKWHEDIPSTPYGYNRAESPVASSRRGLTTEFLGLQNLQIRRASARSINNEAPTPTTTTGFLNRRPSVQPLARSSGNGTPTRQESMQSLKTNGENSDAISMHTDDFFTDNVSPSSPHQTINDMISVSTAAAGPTVQLVERMSSAVRRLESEKVATKEDLARLSAQRDEARAEIVSLMREVETKRAADARVTELEAEVKDLNQRYQTTLEMLGEKSEMVDELKSDIDDIKAMYRELVERTVT
ncbi:related to transcription factor TMF [Phialocephala subalpina]|uniref:Related to transcription factor TMF n=1 Tax=Phialocephala subalpina TaxID=576137 RepID=A0A1L7X7X4_9HELO|nr:related to transcription factor TMF [Phialocephala subalpina]